jgi:hypothetical protein
LILIINHTWLNLIGANSAEGNCPQIIEGYTSTHLFLWVLFLHNFYIKVCKEYRYFDARLSFDFLILEVVNNLKKVQKVMRSNMMSSESLDLVFKMINIVI